MIPKDKLKIGMLIKYVSSTRASYTPVNLIVTSMVSEGPCVNNFETGYHYGLVRQIHFFHKYNTTHEQITEDLNSVGRHY